MNSGVSIEWGESSGAISYEYCIDESDDDTCDNWINVGNAQSISISNLNPLTTYYWQVRAINDTATIYANGSPTSFWSFTTREDILPPTIIVNQAIDQSDPVIIEPILFTATFSEPVVGFEPGDISFTGSTVFGDLVAAISGDGPTYTISVSGMTGDGSVVVSIPADVVTDLAGNLNTASSSTDNSVRYDDIPPTVTINQTPAQRDPAAQMPIIFDVVFSEPIVGFSSNDIDFSNSNAAGDLIAILVGGGPEFTLFVSGMTGSGDIIVSVPASSVKDLAGNYSLLSSSTDNSVMYLAPILWIPLIH